MPTTEDLLKIKKKIDDAKTEQAKLEGQLADRMTRLNILGYGTVEAAEAALEKMHEQLAALDEQVQRGVEELKEEYGL